MFIFPIMKESVIPSVFCNFQDLIEMPTFSPFQCQVQKPKPSWPPCLEAKRLGPAVGAGGSPVLSGGHPGQSLCPRGPGLARAGPVSRAFPT